MNEQAILQLREQTVQFVSALRALVNEKCQNEDKFSLGKMKNNVKYFQGKISHKHNFSKIINYFDFFAYYLRKTNIRP